MIERFIDYMQFSAYINETEIRQKLEPVSPVRFYARGYRDSVGSRIYFGNPNSKKALVVMAGQAMEATRELAIDAEILRWAFDKGAEISRLDLAVTQWQTFDGFTTVEDIKSWSKQGIITSHLMADGFVRAVSSITSKHDTVETLYIGDMKKRAKRGIFRAYDKGIELKLGEYMATRLELELRQESANATALRIAQSNDIAGNFRSKFDVKHKDFDKIMDADAVSTLRGKARQKSEGENEAEKRWTWLINQVAPALKEAIEKDEKELRFDRINEFLSRSGIGQKVFNKIRTQVEFEVKQRTMLVDLTKD